MTLVQEASKKMESLPEDSVRVIIALIERMKTTAKTESSVSDARKKFLETAGKIDIDEAAVSEFRERSMI